MADPLTLLAMAGTVVKGIEGLVARGAELEKVATSGTRLPLTFRRRKKKQRNRRYLSSCSTLNR